MSSTTNGAWRSYTYFIICTLFIYLTIPFARTVQKFVHHQIGRSFFGYFVLVVVFAGAVGVVLFIIRNKPRETSTSSYLWLAAIVVTYVYFTIGLWKNPEEAIHFLEYGLLSYFAFRALTHHVRDVSIYITASLLTLLVGIVDEIIQWMWPGRYWDIRDVGLNFLAGVLFQLGIYKGITPDIISEKVQPKSIRIFSVVLAACILLLGLCASNTPSRIAGYTKRFPILSFLRSNASMMSEFGYKHEDPDIGTFYSRFTKDELKSKDTLFGETHAEILNETKEMVYSQFLKKYNPVYSPFLYEMRIHLFRRDRHLDRGIREPEKRSAHFAISFKENLILEKYFGETLKLTDFKWSDAKREDVLRQTELPDAYESPVSSELFTSFGERALWAAIGFVLLCLLFLNVGMTKRLNYKAADRR